jgi:hypothetical protein
MDQWLIDRPALDEAVPSGNAGWTLFTAIERQAIRIGLKNLALLGRRRASLKRVSRWPMTSLADQRLESIRVLVIAAGCDPIGSWVLDAHRDALGRVWSNGSSLRLSIASGTDRKIRTLAGYDQSSRACRKGY